MRIVAHLLSIVLIIPQALIFASVTLLQHVTATRTLQGILMTTLDTLNVLFGWGGLAMIAILGLIIGSGFSDKWRVVAASCVLGVDIYTAAYLLLWMKVSTIGDGIFFSAPGALAATLCIWVIRRDMLDRRLTPAILGRDP